MPGLRYQSVVELTRSIKAYFGFEAGIVRGRLPDRGDSQIREQLEQAQRQLAEKDDLIARLQSRLVAGGSAEAVDPGNLVWIFGTGRTGSTWLGSMIGDLPGYALWDESMIAKMFGDLYHTVGGRFRRDDRYFILGGPEEARNATIRTFVLREAGVRFPELYDGGRVVLKEPGGSPGSPLILKALPETRMIFLIRDFRDSIASFIQAQKKGAWMYENRVAHNPAYARAVRDEGFDARVAKERSNQVLHHVRNAREAYEAHDGPKVLVRYEELRGDTPKTMRRIFSELRLPVDDEELERVVEKHAWENVPEEEKGEGKFKRKATPGSWKEDLTPQQIRIVERQISPLLKEFGYA